MLIGLNMPTPKVNQPTYEANQPAFLQRLRAQNGGADAPKERPTPRPQTSKIVDEDDGPLIIDETTNEVVTKSQYLVHNQGVTNGEVSKPDEQMASEGAEDETVAVAPSVTAGQSNAQNVLVGSKKRKPAQASIVCETQWDNQDDEFAKDPREYRSFGRGEKPKRRKIIKLAFEDG